MTKSRQITILSFVLSGILLGFGLSTLGYALIFNKSNCGITNDVISKNTNTETIKSVIENYFSFNSVSIISIDTVDLNIDGLKQEYFVVYQTNDKRIFYDCFLNLHKNEWLNVFHELNSHHYKNIEVIQLSQIPYLIKWWNDGSGGFLSCELYRLDNYFKLKKVFEIPTNISSFMGEIIITNQNIFLNLAGKNYILSEDVSGSIKMDYYPTRLNPNDIQNSEYLLTVNNTDYQANLEIILNGGYYYNVKVALEENGGILESIDTFKISVNDLIWIDSNSELQTSLRFLGIKGFKFNSGLYKSIIANEDGFQKLEFERAYGAKYALKFLVSDGNDNF